MKWSWLSLVLLACVLVSCKQNAKEDAAMSAAKETMAANKATMEKMFTGFANDDPSVVDACVAPDMVEHTPDPMIKSTGMQAVKDAMQMMKTAYPDMKMKVNFMMADGDLAMGQFTFTGTNTGSYGDMPACNKPVNIDGVDIARLKDGKIVEHWGYVQEGKMMTQLGLMPMPGEQMGKEGGMEGHMDKMGGKMDKKAMSTGKAMRKMDTH